MGRSAVMSTVDGSASRDILMCQQLGIDTMHIVSKSQQEMVSRGIKHSIKVLEKVIVKDIRIKP